MTNYQGFDASRSVTEIVCRDGAEPGLREVAERSVATLAARAEAAVARARAAEADLDRLTGALDAPLVALIEADQAAVKALQELRGRQLIEQDSSDELRVSELPVGELPTSGVVTVGAGRDPVIRTLATFPPYDFSWSWHDGHGFAPHSQVLNRPSGRVGLDARSGLLDGGVSGFVAAHAGFGVLLRTDHPATRTGGAVFDHARLSFVMKAVGVGSNATTEGGLELTALENGRLIASTSNRLWRRKISAGESASGGPGAGEFRPTNLTFTMQPGREYTFNVGIWVFTDRSTGIGGGAVQALFEGNVSSLFVAG